MSNTNQVVKPTNVLSELSTTLNQFQSLQKNVVKPSENENEIDQTKSNFYEKVESLRHAVAIRYSELCGKGIEKLNAKEIEEARELNKLLTEAKKVVVTFDDFLSKKQANRSLETIKITHKNTIKDFAKTLKLSPGQKAVVGASIALFTVLFAIGGAVAGALLGTAIGSVLGSMAAPGFGTAAGGVSGGALGMIKGFIEGLSLGGIIGASVAAAALGLAGGAGAYKLTRFGMFKTNTVQSKHYDVIQAANKLNNALEIEVKSLSTPSKTVVHL